jgi:hypothetical protein
MLSYFARRSRKDADRSSQLHYLHAHQIATRAEQAAVRAAGIPWHEYDRFMQKFVKVMGDERLTKVPSDLDTKPYRDEHDDDHLLRRMEAAVATRKLPCALKVAEVRDAIAGFRQHRPPRRGRRPKIAASSRAKTHASGRRSS